MKGILYSFQFCKSRTIPGGQEKEYKMCQSKKCSHVWESEYLGFTHEGGYRNRSRCSECGETTMSYSHSDFNDRHAAEEEK